MIKAIIFDMDGTILDTIKDIAGAVNYILEKYEKPVRTVDEVKSFVGNGLRRTLELSLGDMENKDEFIDSIFTEFTEYYKVHSSDNTKPYDGIVDAIRILKEKGYKTAVVSNKRQEAVEELCVKFYEGLFDIAIGEQDGLKRKPDPAMVNKALDYLGVTKEEAVYIGDSEVDIKTAVNSGLKGIYVSWGFRGAKLLMENGAKVVVANPEELLKVIASCSRDGY